jgi:hypothetical protein
VGPAARSAAIGALCVAVAVSFSARADERAPEPARVAVVPVIVSAAGRPTLSSVFAAVGRGARLRAELELLSEEETFVAGSELAGRVADCGPDAACVASEVRRLGATLGLVVVINAELTPALVGLRLIDGRSGTVIADASKNVAVEEVESAIRDVASELFARAGYEERARLVVRATPPGATIRVDGGTPDRAAANTFIVEPGRHRVTAALEGHEDATEEVEIAAGEERELSLSLVERSSLIESPWLWLAIGAVVAGTVTVTLIATRPRDTYICVPLDGVDCEP